MFFSGTNQELFSFGEFYSGNESVVLESMKKIIPERNKKIGERIQHLLDQKSSRQKDLAIFLGKTHSVISKLCSGQILPTNEVLNHPRRKRRGFFIPTR